MKEKENGMQKEGGNGRVRMKGRGGTRKEVDGKKEGGRGTEWMKELVNKK